MSVGEIGERRQPSIRASIGQLGLIVLLISLGVLFAATVLVFLLARFDNPHWVRPSLPGLPYGLAASTAMIIGTSVSLHAAMKNVRANRLTSLDKSLYIAAAFAVAFLAAQSFNWTDLLRAHMETDQRAVFLVTFFLLTGLHALHVLGGFVPLVLVIRHARRKEYTSSRHEGVKLCVQYWHFLAVVWMFLVAAISIGL